MMISSIPLSLGAMAKTELQEKDKEKLEKLDMRGVQTLFRTMSRNHYSLLSMIDQKASIILTVNSIIVSLIMGAIYFIDDNEKPALIVVTKILLNSSVLSMIFAVLSIIPHRYLGKKYSQSRYSGTLYAHNFARFSLEEFQDEFNRIIASGKNIYNEMIRDIYFLGRVIAFRQKMLWIATCIFLLGLIIAMVSALSHGLNWL
jgi:hypothetical protein